MSTSRIYLHKKYPNSFLDCVRAKYKLTPPVIYHGLGWGRSRYYMHCKFGHELPRRLYPKLAKIVGCTVKQLIETELAFWTSNPNVKKRA